MQITQVNAWKTRKPGEIWNAADNVAKQLIAAGDAVAAEPVADAASVQPEPPIDEPIPPIGATEPPIDESIGNLGLPDQPRDDPEVPKRMLRRRG